MNQTSEPNRMRKVPELLSPAGDWEAMRAAVANGADAIYFGLSAFNARHRAANFSLEELPEAMAYLHAHNVRGYVTFNVLIFSDELPEAVRFIGEIAAAGVDAVIVQDLGIASLIHRLCPTLPIHGSTQMTLTEPLGVEFVHALGVERAILARELSRDDIAKITAETRVPLEVFVHGALCVSYSGQCLTSEALGGRSANRGQCAQACRLPYDLLVDGQHRDLGERAYLLSPQDLAAYDLIDDLAELGVACVKIEGRLKSAHYVAATTQAYRDAIDAAAAQHPFALGLQQQQDLAQSFSRGFTHGFLDGANHQTLVHARFPKSRGLRVGAVVGKTPAGILIRFERGARLKSGDGVVFDEGHPDQDEQGGRIVDVIPSRQQNVSEITLFRGDISLSAIADGSIVWKTDDPEMRKRLEHSFSRDLVVKRAPIHADVTAIEGKPLEIRVTDDAGRSAKVFWDRLLERASKFPASRQLFREQFGRLGDTPFELGEVRVNGSPTDEFPPVMIPKSVLNDLRRQAAAQLIEQRDQTQRHAIAEPLALDHMRDELVALPQPIEVPIKPRLLALARTMEQLEGILKWSKAREENSLPMVYCEFEDIRKYPQAVDAARAVGVPIGLATIRVIRPSEHGLLKQVASAEPDAILIRNLAGLSYFSKYYPQMPLIADYALNVANELTAGIFAAKNVRRMTASYDLTWKQMSAMFARFPANWFEAVVHQHMPMFHMEHCVFAHALSDGKDYRDCGRPCEKHQVDLRDRAGIGHPLVADVGCRNTVYNGTAQSAAEFMQRMVDLGIRHFRVEMLRESAEEATQLLERYSRVLSGQEDGGETWRSLKVLGQLGVTRGTME